MDNPALAKRFAPLVSSGDALARIRTRIAERVELFGVTITDDPDLHLLIDGDPARPSVAWNGLLRFDLLQPPRSLDILSRSGVPAEIMPSSTDRRRLGVALASLLLVSAERQIEAVRVPLDLADGFHPVEHGFRWTNGEARLPAHLLDTLEGPVTIEIRVRATTRYAVQSGADRQEKQP
jgi:hypothetical protein